MTKRYFNWKLAIVLVTGLVILGITAYGLRQWQRRKTVVQGLILGNRAYNEHRWQEAAKNLGRYLTFVRDDVPILLKYADAQLNIRPHNRNNIQQAVAAYRAILRVDKNNSKATNKLTEIYLLIGMPGEAELIAKRHLNSNQNQELRRMLAIALARQRKFDEAAEQLKSIITEHPEQILAYEILGQLAEQRPENFPDPPGHWFNLAVKNNPSSALAYIIRAGFHLRNQERIKAIADLEQAEKLDLSDNTARLRLATEFINANILDNAEQHLSIAQDSDPTSQLLWQTWAELALKSQSKTMMLKVAETGLKELSFQPYDFMPTAVELYIRCDKLDCAGDCISRLRQKDIAPPTTAFLEGLLADKKGHGFEAVKCWRRAMESGDKSPRIRLALASVLSRLGDTQSALRQLRTLVSERPNYFPGRLAITRLLAQTRNFSEAVEQARIAKQISPDSLDAALLYFQTRLQLLAESQTEKDSSIYKEIEVHLTELENVTHGALDVKLMQFQLALQQGNFTDAEALIAELKKAHPSEIKVALAEVELAAARKREDEAILTLNNIIEQFPDATEPVEYLAILLARQDKQGKCEGIITEALTRIEEPVSQRNLCFLLADLYNQWGQEEKAYKLLTSLIRKLPNDVSTKRRLLQCEQVIKNLNEAQELVNNIKSLEGEEGWQWRYEQARIYFAMDDFKAQYPKIVSLLQENLLANPDDQASRRLLAAAYERAGALQLAISTYRDALARSPDDLHIIIPTVDALYKAEEYDQAEEILNRASRQKIYHPQLQRLQLQSYLRRGELSSASDILEDLLTNDPNNQAVNLSLALLKMQQKKFAKAGELLAKLKIQDPNSLQVAVAQIRLNLYQGKAEEALRLCDEIVNNHNNASAYILRAKTYTKLGQTDRAIQDVEHASAIEPNSVEVWVAKSKFYRSIGQLDKAIADIQQALSMAPSKLQIKKHAISLFLESGNADQTHQARTILDNAFESNPEDIDLRLFKTRLLLAKGTSLTIENAERILRKITEDHPKNTDAWVLLGELAIMQRQPGKAIDIALQGLAHTINYKPLLLLKAKAEAQRSPILAIPTLKSIREQNPNDVDATVLLAQTYIAAQEPEKAVSLLRTQLASSNTAKDQRRINVALAVAMYKNGDKQDAQEIFNSLYESAPNDPSPLFAQAKLLKDDQLWSQLKQKVIHWCQNHPKDTHTTITIAGDLINTENTQAKKIAEDILRMILQSDSDCTEAMIALATLLQITDRSSESARLYQQLLELEPNNIIAINNLSWIMCEKHGKHLQALELAQRGLEKAPDYIDLIDTRGVVYYRLGEYDKAVQDLTRCINLYPAETQSAVASHFHLARALASLGHKNKAIENLKRALELNMKVGGLSAADLDDTQRLLKELSRGG